MSDFTSQFLTTPQQDPDMADYERRMAQAGAEDAAAEDSPLSVMLGPIGQKAFAGYVKASVKTQGITNRMAAGLTEAALQVYNTVESGVQAVAEAVVGEQPSQTTMTDLVTRQQKPKGPALLATPTWNDAPIKEALTRLRDESRAEAERQLAGEDSLVGNLTEGTVQFMVPFSLALKAQGGMVAGAKVANIAKGAVAEGVTMFGAFDPHAGRFADLLRAVSPDGLAANRYIDWLTSREDEGELEGRFKNVVDSLSGSAAIAGTLAVGGKTLRTIHKSATTPTQAQKKTAISVDLKPETKFLSAESEFGTVGGHIKENSLHISHAQIDEASRGKGEGIKLYSALVDKALADGMTVYSDSTVEASAVRMYEALKRRGYDVRRLEGGQLKDGAVYGKDAKSPAFQIVAASKGK